MKARMILEPSSHLLSFMHFRVIQHNIFDVFAFRMTETLSVRLRISHAVRRGKAGHLTMVTKMNPRKVTNCVPSCRTCNLVKEGLDPEKVTKIPQENIQRVGALCDFRGRYGRWA